MDKKVRLMIGPSAIAPRVLHAMNRQIISHRTPEYMEMHKRISDNLKKLFQTENDVLMLTSSGTGAMQAAIQNCFSPGDKVVVAINGNFGERFAIISEIFGLEVTRVHFDLEETTDAKEVMKYVDADTKGVFLIHNESTTGIYNDLESFGDALKDTNALLIVDAISGIGGLEMKMDEWHVDVVIAGSQKALMTPPGIAFIALSEKAWAMVEGSTNPKYYFDLKRARESHKINQTPWTCAVSLVYGVEEALNMIFEEGLENVYKRHSENAQLIRDGARKLGYSLFPKDEKYASPTVTSISAPGKAVEIVEKLAEKNIMIGNGLAPLREDIFRVGTMGYVSKSDVAAFLYALEEIGK